MSEIKVVNTASTELDGVLKELEQINLFNFIKLISNDYNLDCDEMFNRYLDTSSKIYIDSSDVSKINETNKKKRGRPPKANNTTTTKKVEKSSSSKMLYSIIEVNDRKYVEKDNTIYEYPGELLKGMIDFGNNLVKIGEIINNEYIFS